MLPAGKRIRRSADFATVVRRGSRVGRATLVVHLLIDPDGGPPRAGFVVSKAVGGAVVRNAVTRRLRELVRARLDLLPRGTRLLVRALPAAATASSSTLAADLDPALDRALVAASGGRGALR